jgi:DNA mismatch endonuclease, patch repair protein
MTDVFSKRKRSWLMSRIRVRDTAPERVVRSVLRSEGFRFRTHVATLPGKPDFLLSKSKMVIFVHGCFWHGHRHCKKGTHMPKSNEVFWMDKIRSNASRDSAIKRKLRAKGWCVIIVWECETKSREKLVNRLRKKLETA